MPNASIVARLDRLPPSRYFVQLVALIAVGGWFECYEFAMPGGISLGLTKTIFTTRTETMLTWNSFASFLGSFFLGMYMGAFTFSFSRISAIIMGYVVTFLLSAYGTAGVFTMIAVAMLFITLAVGIMGPTSNRQSLEVLSR